MSALWFDSKVVEMMTAGHCMYVAKFCELLACQCIRYSSGELNIMLGTYMFSYFNYDVSNLQELGPA